MLSKLIKFFAVFKESEMLEAGVVTIVSPFFCFILKLYCLLCLLSFIDFNIGKGSAEPSVIEKEDFVI